ncbi:hypothetical protein [Engelhardtia mirabilis]|uniref:Uncharacterized protein n=1 Tax=Engelhardtia mirabilis TaxID=2528011 RepID=A0A518BS14_9BACT|nr:hypothetical protein Pla133_48830 [Planctomycetes bacterium Pla133]QDV04087.1 hypothetical protein Pla86_48810 [Planctomycetes bacterium Pla86]
MREHIPGLPRPLAPALMALCLASAAAAQVSPYPSEGYVLSSPSSASAGNDAIYGVADDGSLTTLVAPNER